MLNEKQHLAVTSNQKYIRVIAGAGSGKTKVLTSKIIHLIKDLSVPVYRILAITFTNKAAQEMKERVENELGIRPPYISTFHSFCVRVLREDIDVLGYSKSFTILDEDDQKQLAKDLIKQTNYKIEPKELIGYISYNKNGNVSPSLAYDLANKIPEYERKALLYKEYEERLKETNSLDFDDLLLKVNQIFSSYPDILNKWKQRFSHILVDEFQDTNDVQYSLIKFLVGKENNLFVVGDPDQTIYTWRGANVNLILNFEYDFKDALTVILDKNYRSSQNILDVSNKLISHNSKRLEKNMSANNGVGEKVVTMNFFKAEEEANWVVEKIQELKLKGENYKNFAILYRANYLSRQLEMSLINYHIPYRIYGGLKFFERKEIKDALAYLRLVVNQEDDLAFLRIINSPKRGIGDTTLDSIKEHCYSSHLPIYTYLKNDRSLIRVNKDKVNNALDLLFQTIDKVKNVTTDFPLILKTILEDVGYYTFLEDDENKDERIQNIGELLNGLMTFQNNNPESTLDEYLQQITLYSGQDEIKDGEFVSLMTVHTAKGLEFDNVFIYGFNEGVFPSARSIEESAEGIEEERRIAYVAITRARKKLFITSNNDYNFASKMCGSVSRFINEMGLAKIYDLRKNNKDNYKQPFIPKKEKITPINAVPKKNNITWHINDKVFHEKFLEGVVVDIEDGIILTVVFKDPSVGQKIIMGNHPSLSKL